MSDTLERRIVVKVEGLGIGETAVALDSLATATSKIDGSRLTSMTNEVRNLAQAVNGKADFKLFTTNIQELIMVANSIPKDFSGFTNMANSLVPIVGAMNTLAGSKFNVSSLTEEIQKLLILAGADFSRLNNLSMNLATFASSLTGIVMPVIDARPLVDSINRLANASLLPVDRLAPMGVEIRKFITEVTATTLSPLLGDSLISVSSGLKELATASSRDYSGLVSLPALLRDLARELQVLSSTRIDLSPLTASLRALGASLQTLTGGKSTLSNLRRSLTDLQAMIKTMPTTGFFKKTPTLDFKIAKQTWTDLTMLESRLAGIATQLRAIKSAGINIQLLNSGSTVMTAPNSPTNPKTWNATTTSIHSTNRALHFFQTALTTIGFTTFMRLIRESIDEFIELRSRVLLTSDTIETFHEAMSSLWSISEDVRTSIGALSRLFNKFHISLQPFGATVKQSSAFVKALAQSIKISGSNSAETKAFFVQFGQAIQSGVLRGREFRSMLESNLYMSRLLARELAGGDLGRLKEMAFKGQLDTLTVTNAVLRNQGKINKDFERVALTIGDMFELIKNKLIQTMMQWEYSIGQSKYFINTLKWIKENLDGIIVAVTAFVGTTMVQLLFQFGLMRKLIMGLGVGLLIITLKKMYDNSERFRKSVQDSVTYIKELWTKSREAGTGIAGMFDTLIIKAREFYDAIIDMDWDMAFLQLEKQLVKVMAFLDALTTFKGKNKLGLNIKDALQFAFDSVFGKERSNIVREYNQNDLKKTGKEYISTLEDLLDERDALMKKRNKMILGSEFEQAGSKRNDMIANLDAELKADFDRLNDGIQEAKDKFFIAVKLLRKDIYEEDFNIYDDIQEKMKGGYFEGMGAMQDAITSRVLIYENLMREFLEATGKSREVVDEMVNTWMAKLRKYAYSKTPEFEEGFSSEMDRVLAEIDARYKPIEKEIINKAKKTGEGIKTAIEESLAPEIKGDTLLSGLFTKYFPATFIETDITWTPNLEIKLKKSLAQDWIESMDFKAGLEKGLTADENIIRNKMSSYFEMLNQLAEAEAKKMTVMAKFPEGAEVPKDRYKEIQTPIDDLIYKSRMLREEIFHTTGKGQDLESFYERLQKIVSVPEGTTSDRMQEIQHVLASVVQVAEKSDVSVDNVIRNMEKGLTAGENYLDTMAQLVASGASFEIMDDFYGKIGDINELLSEPEMFATIQKRFPEIFTQAWESADQFQDKLIEIANILKYKEFQNMTDGKAFNEGVLQGFKDLYMDYEEIINDIAGLTTQIFEDLALEANKFFLGIEEDWKGFVNSMSKQVSDWAFKAILFGQNGIMQNMGVRGFEAKATIDSVNTQRANTELGLLGSTTNSVSLNMEGLNLSAGSLNTEFISLMFSAQQASLALASVGGTGGLSGNTTDITTPIVKGLFDNIAGLWDAPNITQMGGSADKGEPTWVGESGRELFIPDSKGHVYNNTNSEAKNKAMAGSGAVNLTVVNLDDKNKLISMMNVPRNKRAVLNMVGETMTRAKR
jgi:tape measure domain-containing protein